MFFVYVDAYSSRPLAWMEKKKTSQKNTLKTHYSPTIAEIDWKQ